MQLVYTECMSKTHKPNLNFPLVRHVSSFPVPNLCYKREEERREEWRDREGISGEGWEEGWGVEIQVNCIKISVQKPASQIMEKSVPSLTFLSVQPLTRIV